MERNKKTQLKKNSNQGRTDLRIGKVIRELLLTNNCSLNDISKGTDIPYTTLNHWLDNRTPRKIEDVKKLARFFNITLHYLLFGTEDSALTYPTKETVELGDNWYQCRLSLKTKDGSEFEIEGLLIKKAKDVIKDPYILEFIGLQEQTSYSENDLEQALMNKLEHFLLELGSGFTSHCRQV